MPINFKIPDVYGAPPPSDPGAMFAAYIRGFGNAADYVAQTGNIWDGLGDSIAQAAQDYRRRKAQESSQESAQEFQASESAITRDFQASESALAREDRAQERAQAGDLAEERIGLERERLEFDTRRHQDSFGLSESEESRRAAAFLDDQRAAETSRGVAENIVNARPGSLVRNDVVPGVGGGPDTPITEVAPGALGEVFGGVEGMSLADVARAQELLDRQAAAGMSRKDATSANYPWAAAEATRQVKEGKTEAESAAALKDGYEAIFRASDVPITEASIKSIAPFLDVSIVGELSPKSGASDYVWMTTPEGLLQVKGGNKPEVVQEVNKFLLKAQSDPRNAPIMDRLRGEVGSRYTLSGDKASELGLKMRAAGEARQAINRKRDNERQVEQATRERAAKLERDMGTRAQRQSDAAAPASDAERAQRDQQRSQGSSGSPVSQQPASVRAFFGLGEGEGTPPQARPQGTTPAPQGSTPRTTAPILERPPTPMQSAAARSNGYQGPTDTPPPQTAAAKRAGYYQGPTESSPPAGASPGEGSPGYEQGENLRRRRAVNRGERRPVVREKPAGPPPQMSAPVEERYSEPENASRSERELRQDIERLKRASGPRTTESQKASYVKQLREQRARLSAMLRKEQR